MSDESVFALIAVFYILCLIRFDYIIKIWVWIRNYFLGMTSAKKPYSCQYLHNTVQLEMQIYKKVLSEDALEHVKTCPKSRTAELVPFRKTPKPPQPTLPDSGRYKNGGFLNGPSN